MAKGKPRRLSKAEIKAKADRAEARSRGEDVKPEASIIDPPETATRDKATGRFLRGNRFWEARSSAGPKPKFAKGEDLWKACCEYFAWVEANPLWEDRLVTFQGIATHEPVAKMRAMTIAGLCLFLDIDETTWRREWRMSRPDLLPVITRVEAVIASQKFAGAAADLLNANIIARDLGLADKSELTGKDGGPIQLSDTNDIDQARRVAFALARVLERQKGKVSDASR